jgi:hypothetical protein
MFFMLPTAIFCLSMAGTLVMMIVIAPLLIIGIIIILINIAQVSNENQIFFLFTCDHFTAESTALSTSDIAQLEFPSKIFALAAAIRSNHHEISIRLPLLPQKLC